MLQTHAYLSQIYPEEVKEGIASVVFAKVNTWEVNDGGNRVTVYGGGKMFDCEDVCVRRAGQR